MVINTNVAAQSSARLLGGSSNMLTKSLARLASGSKIISPENDCAGLAVSMRFDAQINRTQAVISNLGNTLSFCQTQDGFLKKIGAALDRMSELSILSQDVTKGDRDRNLYNQEFQTLAGYINDVVTKDFNGVSLFSREALNVIVDSEGGTLQLAGMAGTYVAPPPPPPPQLPQPYTASTAIGEIRPGFTSGYIVTGIDDFVSVNAATTVAGLVSQLNSAMQPFASGNASYDARTGTLSVTVNPHRFLSQLGNNPLTALGLSNISNSGSTPLTIASTLTFTPPPIPTAGPLDISTASGAASALAKVRSAINQLAGDRAAVGASIARLNLTAGQLGILKDNLSAANSRITDVDIAQESTEFARYNILVQAGAAMLSQANSTPGSILRLLG